MGRYALVRDGVTEAVIVWDGVSPYTPPPGCKLVPEAEAPPRSLAADSAPPVPETATLRNLLRALTKMGLISRKDALAAARTGAIPAGLSAPLFAAVDEDTSFELELAWAAMYEAERASPFWRHVIAAGIATEEQIDDVFRLSAMP